MNTRQIALLLIGGLAISGCRRDAAVPVDGSPASQPSPAAEKLIRAVLPSQTNQVIEMGTVHIDGGIRHLSPAQVLLESEPGEDVTRAIQPDMTLIDDRHMQ